MRHAGPAIIVAVIALVAALGFAQAAADCATTSCVYVPLIRAAAPPTPTNTPVISVTLTPTPGPAPTRTPTPDCAAEYPDFCIPPPPPDLNCSDIGVHNFTALPPDRHHFDTDHDGIGCEQK